MDLSLLDEQHGAPPPFPLDVLPPFWRTWTEAAIASTGAPADYVALSLLTAAGSLIPGRRVMPAPGWVEPCILWTALVGPSSCGKTPAVDAACGLLNGVWHQRQRGPHNPDGRALPKPLLTNGTSLDIILEVLRESRRGVLLVRDEQEGWLAHMARGTRDGSAHAFWLSAWCQRSLDFGWRGKTAELDDPSLSILGTAHPEALVPALRRDDGGVLARFLFVRPVPQADYRPLLGADAQAPQAVAALRRLYERPWEMRDLSLTGEALVVFEHFRREHCFPTPDLAGKAAAWWGKGPSQVLRLAGVLTFLDWAATPEGTAEPQQVPAWAVEAAVRLWRDHLWPHAQATFRIAGAGGEHEGRQRQVVRWLARQRLPEVSREHIRRDALQQALNAASTERLIDDLVEGGWLRPVAPATGGRGRRRRRWHVHAGLWATRPSEVHLPEARPHPGPVERASGASPAAGDPVPPDAVSAIPASPFDAGTVLAVEQVDLGVTPTISAFPASDFGMALPVTVAQGQFDAAPGVPAVPASASAAWSASPAAAQPDLDAVAVVSAIRASDSDAAIVSTAPSPGKDRIPSEAEGRGRVSLEPEAAGIQVFEPPEIIRAIPATGFVAAMDRSGINGLPGEVGDSGDCGRLRKTAEDGAHRRKPLESRGTRETPELRKLRQRLGVPPSSASTPEAAPLPPDELCAIPASESAAIAPIAFRQVEHAGGTDTAHAGSGNGVPPRLGARARRRLRRREKLAQLRNVDSTRQGVAA